MTEPPPQRAAPPPPLRKRTELLRALAQLEGFPHPDARTEQVVTPAEAASELLWEAFVRGDIVGRRVLDLGCGTGVLAIGAALLGAASVTGVDQDPEALSVARENARRANAEIAWVQRELGSTSREPPVPLADTVVMNPPFGAQRKHADRPFLEAAAGAISPSGGAVYLLSNAASQAFIERWSIARHLTIEDHRRSPWTLPPTFPHHREARGRIEVDRWVLRSR
ncbi:MAG: methyltransferase [Euryarchaeota archaeon]|nr:methyltransferase [Euryarchaeota archaeon]MDE1836091.1 methyltransferase [Euryarchaeota archaeon]MDE1879381.1 methyltransferase [Euryarchaeota archaeon]MDE2044069.1 methyltransferase [Thermoplasmata archaeon]